MGKLNILLLCGILFMFLISVANMGVLALDPPNDFQRLRLTSMCSAEPTIFRTWRVWNNNSFDLIFKWDVYKTNQTGLGIAVAKGHTYFNTSTVGGPNHPNTVRIFVNSSQQDVKASGGAKCAPAQDTIAPVITLNGEATLNLYVGEAYVELGAVVTDNVNMGLNATIDSSAVNTAVAGIYNVTYDAADFSGNNATRVIRIVIVSVPPIINPPFVNARYVCTAEKAQRGLCPGWMTCSNLSIVNNAGSPLEVIVNWTETYNQYGTSSYSTNTPFVQTLNPGANWVFVCFTWQCNHLLAVVEGRFDILLNEP